MSPTEFFEAVLKDVAKYYGSLAPKEIAEIPTESWDNCVFGEHFVFPHSLPLSNDIPGNELSLLATFNLKEVFKCSVDLYKHLEPDPNKILAPQGLYVWTKGQNNGLRIDEHRFARTTIYDKVKPEEIAYFLVRRHSGPMDDQFGGKPLLLISW